MKQLLQGFNGEDVLILEYCDGSTLYDLYAREHPKASACLRLHTAARMVSFGTKTAMCA